MKDNKEKANDIDKQYDKLVKKCNRNIFGYRLFVFLKYMMSVLLTLAICGSAFWTPTIINNIIHTDDKYREVDSVVVSYYSPETPEEIPVYHDNYYDNPATAMHEIFYRDWDTLKDSNVIEVYVVVDSYNNFGNTFSTAKEGVIKNIIYDDYFDKTNYEQMEILTKYNSWKNDKGSEDGLVQDGKQMNVYIASTEGHFNYSQILTFDGVLNKADSRGPVAKSNSCLTEYLILYGIGMFIAWSLIIAVTVFPLLCLIVSYDENKKERSMDISYIKKRTIYKNLHNTKFVKKPEADRFIGCVKKHRDIQTYIGQYHKMKH